MATINTRDASKFVVTTNTPCPHTGKPCGPATTILKRLEAGIHLAHRSGMVEADFEIEGTVGVKACKQPCTLAYQASATSIRLVCNAAADAPAVLVAERRPSTVHLGTMAS